MTSISRQNTLFVAEDWRRIYEALSNIDFTAYDQDALRNAVMEYINLTYADEYNDWIGSSEFIIKLDVLTYLAQSLSYRIDLNTRENFLTTAERRDSLLRLAYNIAYRVSRNQAATGEVKIHAISTNQDLLDLDDNAIKGQVSWNDPSDPDWFDKWTIIMNAALSERTKYGSPLRRYRKGDDISLYRLNSPSPANGVYKFSSTSSVGSLSYEIINALLDENTGVYSELVPNRFNSFHMLYRSDGKGAGSTGTGYFLPFKQGKLDYIDSTFTDASPMRTINVNVNNINDTDVFVTQIDANGDTVEEWTQVDSVLNESIAYHPSAVSSKVFEVVTKSNDQITIRFGDGKFGAIPTGIFRVWYRTSSAFAPSVKAADIKNKTTTIPYVSNGEIYNLNITFSLVANVDNASTAETNDDIRNRANKVFYTQNRMVTGEDYNSFMYSDPSILKVKSVNRTFSGHGKSVPLRDPSGTYNNVNAYGTDGRIFKDDITASTKAIFDQSIESTSSFITDYVSPLIKKEDKQILYYDVYPKFIIPSSIFTVTSEANDRSLGKVDTAITNGDLDKIVPNSILFFSNGENARIDYVVSGKDGTANNDILLKRKVSFTSASISKIMPPLRRAFTSTEESEIAERLLLRRSFAIAWDNDSVSWTTINTEDVSSSLFSLEYQGDKTGASRDASWMIRLEYKVGATGEDEWTITERGLSIDFESESEVEFIHVSDKEIVDDKTGKKLRDNISLLETNETKDSLDRRGIKSSIGSDPYAGKILIQGDGVTKSFDLNVDKVDTNTIFFLVDNVPTPRSDWKIDTGTGKPVLTFDAAPTDGQFVTVIFDPRKTYGLPIRKDYTGDGNTPVYSLSNTNVRTDNTFAFKATKLLQPYEDYTVYDVSTESRIKYQTTPGDGQALSVNYIHGGAPSFISYNYVGDGTTDSYQLRLETSFVMVFVNGDRTTEFTLNTSVANAYEIVFDDAPNLDAKIHIRALLYDDIFKVDEVSYTATLGQTNFEPPAAAIVNAGVTRTMVWVNGAYQHSFTYDDGIDDVILSSPLSGDEEVIITNFTVTGSLNVGYDYIQRSAYNVPAIYLPQPEQYLVHDRLRHSDGYANIRGIRITNIDEDLNGSIDNPFGFSDFVIDDDKSDLVLWRQVTENGFDIWEPISETSTPRGTYHSTNHIYNNGDAITSGTSVDDIHYDRPNDEWLVAGESTWTTASDQTAYKHATGRSGLSFRWQHYTSEDHRIDPAASNIIDVFVLTKNFDNSMRKWVSEGGTEPTPPTSNQIRTQYQNFESFKMLSDALVWHPARYKILFGQQAEPELRAKFLVVRTPGSTIPDNDLKIRVLEAIDRYFDVSLWDFGEQFYYTELCSSIHKELATVIQSIVPVSIKGGSFGKLFQIRAEPDQLFLPTATASEIEIVDSLTDSRLNIS